MINFVSSNINKQKSIMLTYSTVQLIISFSQNKFRNIMTFHAKKITSHQEKQIQNNGECQLGYLRLLSILSWYLDVFGYNTCAKDVCIIFLSLYILWKSSLRSQNKLDITFLTFSVTQTWTKQNDAMKMMKKFEIKKARSHEMRVSIKRC